MLNEEDKALEPLMRVVHSTAGVKGVADVRLNYVLLRMIITMILNPFMPACVWHSLVRILIREARHASRRRPGGWRPALCHPGGPYLKQGRRGASSGSCFMFPQPTPEIGGTAAAWNLIAMFQCLIDFVRGLLRPARTAHCMSLNGPYLRQRGRVASNRTRS